MGGFTRPDAIIIDIHLCIKMKLGSSVHKMFHGQESSTSFLARTCGANVLSVSGRVIPVAQLLESYAGRSSEFYARYKAQWCTASQGPVKSSIH